MTKSDPFQTIRLALPQPKAQAAGTVRAVHVPVSAVGDVQRTPVSPATTQSPRLDEYADIKCAGKIAAVAIELYTMPSVVVTYAAGLPLFEIRKPETPPIKPWPK